MATDGLARLFKQQWLPVRIARNLGMQWILEQRPPLHVGYPPFFCQEPEALCQLINHGFFPASKFVDIDVWIRKPDPQPLGRF